MASIHGRAETPNARRYMTQLCKHWSHRFAVRYDESVAEIPLPTGDCLLRVEPDHLAIDLEAWDASELARLQAVVADHLKRFAFREPVEVVWNEGTSA